MAKYSTGGVGSDDADSCELCGRETSSLRETTVAGARLQVCDECTEHGEETGGGGRSGGSDSDEERERRRKAAQQAARIDDARKGDSTHWEEDGTDYQDDPLPYLVRGYDDRLEEARQEAGLQPDELAEELGVDEEDVLAVEQGRATRAGVGGSLIEALEERLDIELSEEA